MKMVQQVTYLGGGNITIGLATAGTGIPVHAWYNPSWENIGLIHRNYLSPDANTN